MILRSGEPESYILRYIDLVKLKGLFFSILFQGTMHTSNGNFGKPLNLCHSGKNILLRFHQVLEFRLYFFKCPHVACPEVTMNIVRNSLQDEVVLIAQIPQEETKMVCNPWSEVDNW